MPKPQKPGSGPRPCLARFIWSRPFVIGLCLFLLSACSGEEKKAVAEQKAAIVRVRTVEQRDMPRLVHAVGNVKASATVGVKPRVTGEIRQIHFTEGQEVSEGQPLVTIDTRPYEATLRERKGQLAKSKAQLQKALEDTGRYGKLVGGGHVSRETYEEKATDAAALRATVQSDQAAVDSAALDLDYCTIRAPISGRAGALAIDRGNMVKASDDSSVIVTLDTFAPIHVSFSVPEVHLPAIIERMRSGEVRLMAAPSGGKAEQGLLSLVDNTVDSRTGTIRLRATFANQERNLWPGQFVELDLPLGIAENALVVPTRAVLSGRDGHHLYLVRQDKAVLLKVDVLFESGGKSVVSGELGPGEKVVVEGHIRLADGLPVRIVE